MKTCVTFEMFFVIIILFLFNKFSFELKNIFIFFCVFTTIDIKFFYINFILYYFQQIFLIKQIFNYRFCQMGMCRNPHNIGMGRTAGPIGLHLILDT